MRRRRARAATLLTAVILAVIAGALLALCHPPLGLAQAQDANAPSPRSGRRNRGVPSSWPRPALEFRDRYPTLVPTCAWADELHRAGRIEDAFFVLSAAHTLLRRRGLLPEPQPRPGAPGKHLGGAAFDPPRPTRRARERLAADPETRAFTNYLAHRRGAGRSPGRAQDHRLRGYQGRPETNSAPHGPRSSTAHSETRSAVPWYSKAAASGPDTHEGRLVAQRTRPHCRWRDPAGPGHGSARRCPGAPQGTRAALPDSPAAFLPWGSRPWQGARPPRAGHRARLIVNRDLGHAGALPLSAPWPWWTGPDAAVKALAAWRRNPQDLTAQKLAQLASAPRGP